MYKNLKQTFAISPSTLPGKIAVEDYVRALQICFKYEYDNGIENWRIIPGFRKYYASTFGRVKSTVRGSSKILTSLKKGRYSYINLSVNGQRKQYRLDYLVALTFFANTEFTKIVHLDGNDDNCKVLNLAIK